MFRFLRLWFSFRAIYRVLRQLSLLPSPWRPWVRYVLWGHWRPRPLGYVRLSWPSVLDCAAMSSIEVRESDNHYQLYVGCLRYLRTQLPVASWTRPAVDALVKRTPTQQHPLCRLLANHLKRRFAEVELEHLPDRGMFPPPHDMLDFIFSGFIAVAKSAGVEEHLGAPPSPSEESDKYQILFLVLMSTWWRNACREPTPVAEWSPMPWSSISQRELSGMQTIPETIAYMTPSLDGGIFPHLDADPDIGRLTRVVRLMTGSPMDIRWFGGPHDGYPLCSSLSSYTKLRRDGIIPSPQDDVALWVSVMTLGLLEAVTRTRLTEALFLVPGPHDGELVLSGHRILQFLVIWQLKARINAGHAAFYQHGREVAQILERALHALDEETRYGGVFARAGTLHQGEASEVFCAIAFTLVPLCTVSSVVVWGALPDMDRLRGKVKQVWSFYADMSATWKPKMARAGWCKSTIYHRFSVVPWSLPVTSYVAQLPPFIRSAPDEHKNCTESACVFYNIADVDAYVPRHVEAACHCGYINPPLDEITRLLSGGIVPVLVYDGKALRVQPAAAEPYVAISHVWADGMGSVAEDGLPTCVVERIAGLARQLLPLGAFWVDSLCVPSIRHLRKRAIKLMAQTYRDAAKVLVIDACIRTQCSRSKPWEENLTRIATSGWVQRVWTLQEGMLARELYFELQDGPVNVEEELGLKVPASRPPNQPVGLLHMLPDLYLRWTGALVPVLECRARDQHPSPTGTSSLSFDQVLMLLRDRTSTKAEDEIIAISSLLPLGVDLDALLAIEGDDVAQRRMKEFLLQRRAVPISLPTKVADRLTLPGFSWAPRTLASWGQVGNELGTCTVDGFLAEYWVAPLKERLPAIPLDPHELARQDDAGPSRFGPESTMYVLYRPSEGSTATAYGVLPKTRIGDSSPKWIDALLFLSNENLSAGASLVCFAVCSTDATTQTRAVGLGDSPDGMRGASQEHPLDYRFVAATVLIPAPDSDVGESYSTGSLATTFLGELCKNWVRLT